MTYSAAIAVDLHKANDGPRPRKNTHGMGWVLVPQLQERVFLAADPSKGNCLSGVLCIVTPGNALLRPPCLVLHVHPSKGTQKQKRFPVKFVCRQVLGHQARQDPSEPLPACQPACLPACPALLCSAEGQCVCSSLPFLSVMDRDPGSASCFPCSPPDLGRDMGLQHLPSIEGGLSQV